MPGSRCLGTAAAAAYAYTPPRAPCRVGLLPRPAAEPVNAARIAAAKAAACVQDEANTWAGWQRMGYEVKHGSKALFGVDLIHATKGPGAVYKARFFGASQVAAIA